MSGLKCTRLTACKADNLCSLIFAPICRQKATIDEKSNNLNRERKNNINAEILSLSTKEISNSGGSHGDLGMRNSDSCRFRKKKKIKKTFNSKVFLFSFVRELLNLIAVVSSFSCLTLNRCYLVHHFVM